MLFFTNKICQNKQSKDKNATVRASNLNTNIDSIFHIDLDMSVCNKHRNEIISNIKTNVNVNTTLEKFCKSINDYGHFHKKDTIESLNETKIALTKKHNIC